MGRYQYAATYFNQHTVTRVAEVEDGFKIEYGSGGSIEAFGVEKPEGLVGKAQLKVDYDDDSTTLCFSGGVVVVLQPDNYSVSAPHLEEPVWPGRQDEESALPPDPSDERVAQGPDEEWES